MKALTKTWFDFSKVNCSKDNCVFTRRLFFQELSDPDDKNMPIFVFINTLSGAIDLLEYNEGIELKKSVEENAPSLLSDKLFIEVRARGYLFSSYEEEDFIFTTAITDYKYRKYTTDKIIAFFAIDTNCPMKCEYCFERKNEKIEYEFENSVMNLDSFKVGFDFLNLVSGLQNRKIDFVAGWGGEPLQEKHYEQNKMFIEIANHYNMPIAYFSNLAFIGSRLIELLSQNSDCIKFIQTTIDGLDENHDKYRKIPKAFSKTVENINILLKNNLPVIVRTNVNEDNINSLPDIAQFYQDQGWFSFPKFKCFITHTYDRHHIFQKKMTLTENMAYSKYLEFRDKYPLVRKMQGIKFGPSLINIIKAFQLRECLDVTKNDFEVSIEPMISYCFTSKRAEYVFTGEPNYNIYICAECAGLSKFKIGEYYPKLKFYDDNLKLWGIKDNLHTIRSIDTLKRCKKCPAATFCGGYCSLEAISANGNANDVYCKRADSIIKNFLRNESIRLYRRGRILLDNTQNITL